MKVTSVLLLFWVVIGAALFGANAACNGDACTEGQWYGTIFGLIVWGVVGAPLILAFVFLSLTWVLQRFPR